MTADDLRDLFAPFGPVRVRAMFGGLGVYHEERMFALVAEGEVYMKADAESLPAFEAAGSRPFVFEGKGKLVTTSYWLLPDAASDDEDELRRWADMAVQAARRAGAKAPRRAKTRKPAR